jgi:hypothetical protein
VLAVVAGLADRGFCEGCVFAHYAAATRVRDRVGDAPAGEPGEP